MARYIVVITDTENIYKVEEMSIIVIVIAARGYYSGI